MWVSLAPYHISIAGGGSDYKGWYSKEPGAVFGFSIEQKVWLVAGDAPEKKWVVRNAGRAEYESLDDDRDIFTDHKVIREAVLACDKRMKPVDVSFHSDLPGYGRVVSDAGPLTVSALHLFSSISGKALGSLSAADLSAKVQNDRLKRNIGLQEIYSSAYGGANLLQFDHFGFNKVTGIPRATFRKFREYVSSHCALVYVPFNNVIDCRDPKHLVSHPLPTRRYAALAKQTFEHVSRNNFPFLAEAIRLGWECKQANHHCDGPGASVANDLTAMGIASKLCGGKAGGLVLACLSDLGDKPKLDSYCTAHHLMTFPVEPSLTKAQAFRLNSVVA